MLSPWEKELLDHEDYFKVFKKLRGYFHQDNILIGGSYVYSKELGLKWNGKDIDIFLLIPRIETWALVSILELIFDSVNTFDSDFGKNCEKAMKNKNEYYKIENQWKRIICYKNGMMYDLIFVDTSKEELIYNNTGSDISKLYYGLTYGDKDILSLSRYSANAKSNLSVGVCHIMYDKCTEAYASKIERLCNLLDLEIRNG